MNTTFDTRVYVRGARGKLVPIPGEYRNEYGRPLDDLRCDCCNASLMVKVTMPDGRILGRSCYRAEVGLNAYKPRLMVCRTSSRDGRTVDLLRVSDEDGNPYQLAWISVGGESVARGVRVSGMREAVALAKEAQG